MNNEIDYSFHYKHWHNGSMRELADRKPFYDRLLGNELKSLPRNLSVLDYGCGFGHLVSYLSDKFDQVSGVDSSRQQISIALKNNLPVELLQESEYEVWCNRNIEAFDIIFLMDVLEHIPLEYQIQFLKNLGKTLKKKGIIYIKTPNANSLLSSRWRYIDWTHHTSFTERSLEFILHNSGFHNFEYLDDESSFKPNLPFIPRKETLPYYLRSMVRFLWRMYIYSEIGRESLKIPLGVNLFIKAGRL